MPKTNSVVIQPQYFYDTPYINLDINVRKSISRCVSDPLSNSTFVRV